MSLAVLARAAWQRNERRHDAGVPPGLDDTDGRGGGRDVVRIVGQGVARGLARWLGRGWAVRSGAGVPSGR